MPIANWLHDSLPVLLTGASGQLGRSILSATWPEGWEIIGMGRNALDLADPVAIAKTIERGYLGRPWAAVLNAGAYTAVEAAETNATEAWRTNALAVAAIGAACASKNLPLVHVSTDYVFAGDFSRPIEINDPVGPLNVYGASKLGGELAARTSGARTVIIRTSWLVSEYGTNFLKTMLHLAKTRDMLRVINDQISSPTSSIDLAAALVVIVVRLVNDWAAPTGTFHFSNNGSASWADFAREIFRQSALRAGPASKVSSILSHDYSTTVLRPKYTVLSHSAIEKAYDIKPRDWILAVADILDHLVGPELYREPIMR